MRLLAILAGILCAASIFGGCEAVHYGGHNPFSAIEARQ